MEALKLTFQNLSLLLLILKNNLADVLLLMGVSLIGIFIYNTYGVNPAIFYTGVVCVVASFVFGTTKPKKDNGRKY
jgi:hypothetical protein